MVKKWTIDDAAGETEGDQSGQCDRKLMGSSPAYYQQAPGPVNFFRVRVFGLRLSGCR